MKITVTKSVKEEIELPKYFRSGEDRFFMIINDGDTLLFVKDVNEQDARLGIYPNIERVSIISFGNFLEKYGFDEIEYQEFRDAFARVSLSLEKMMD